MTLVGRHVCKARGPLINIIVRVLERMLPALEMDSAIAA